MKKQWMILILTLSALFVALAACSNDDEEAADNDTENNEAAQEQQELEFTDEEKVENDTPVVTVNGEELLGQDYNPIYRQIKTMMHQYGQDVSDTDAVKDQTLNVLVEQELIKQDAIEKGIEVTEEEAQERIDEMVETGGEEQYADALEQFGLSEEEFKEQIMNDLYTVKYVDQELDVEVTDEEVKEVYDTQKEQNEELGEFEEYEEMIRQSLIDQKQGEQLQARVAELTEEAEVEHLI